jgi:hypothetical protein
MAIFLFFTPAVFGQIAAVRMVLKIPTDTATGKKVYVAGSFNGWKAGDSLYQLHPDHNGLYVITLPLFNNTRYEYKYTRGNWNNVETSIHDSDIHNRKLVSADGLVITDTVAAWKKETATAPTPQQVRINTMKDSATEALKPLLNDLQQLLYAYAQNWLRDKPNGRVEKKLNKKAEKKLNTIFEQIVQLLGNVMATLSPEQKAALKKMVDDPKGKNDMINTIGNGIQQVTGKEK